MNSTLDIITSIGLLFVVAMTIFIIPQAVDREAKYRHDLWSKRCEQGNIDAGYCKGGL